MYAASTIYTAAATNRYSNVAAVSPFVNDNEIIAFGSAAYIALWNTVNDQGVYQTLPGHDGVVTAVCFVAGEGAFISADDTGTMKYWMRSNEQFKCIFTVSAHTKSIISLYTIDDVVVTGSSDSTVKIWKLEKAQLTEIQSISLKGKYPLALTLAYLPRSRAFILAIGATERNIQLWTRSDDNFVHASTLSGHEDWVKALAFQPHLPDQECLLLASGSQDGTIRLWNIEPYIKRTTTEDNKNEEFSDDLLDAFEASLGELADAEEGGRQISLKRHILTVKNDSSSSQQFSVTFDALLVGHEAGVTSLAWRPPSPRRSEPTLLSTSTDSSVILWSPSTILGSSTNQTTSIWINRQRFGDIGGQRLGGFVGGLWAQGGLEVIAWGWNGGWRRWRCKDEEKSTNTYENWYETGAITGHAGPVKGLSWSPNGEYFITSSSDQTTRIHGPVTGSEDATPSWHELSRPQVHGYDLIDAAFLDATRFTSIADEKVARVFEAPREFIDLVHNLGVASLAVDKMERPRAATVPPLGLSNKAVEASQGAEAPMEFDSTRNHRRPFEGELAATTLWPEIEKVFGHGYESISLAISSNKKLAATACKATSPEHAVIRVYDTDKWQPFGVPIPGHTLTVTRIAFSPDDQFILSVSRDRSWYLSKREENNAGYVAVAADKSHARIIWDCAWANEGDIFATASRDKTVKVWHIKNIGTKKWTGRGDHKTS
ncbi:hypothetical protein QCA50_000268 [Cerrena zonata]|uniref:Elongator complex protein 2 n=1 Tax=Cerrena zonata TaxID=2478898 RepID=A0AAW0GSK8_9APHY